MRKLTMALAAVLALSATPVLAQDYISGNVGVENTTVAMGRDFGDLRGEVNYTSLTGEGSLRQDARVLSVNGYVEPFTIGRVTPFVTAGLGYGQVRTATYSDDALVSNAGVGADVRLTDNWSATAEWRTYFTGDVLDRANGDTDDFSTNVFSIGARYRF